MREMKVERDEERWNVHDFINTVCGKPEYNGRHRGSTGKSLVTRNFKVNGPELDSEAQASRAVSLRCREPVVDTMKIALSLRLPAGYNRLLHFVPQMFLL
jgi:hypothetical protein